ncbi:conserved hypothetical protein [Neospora caninum Liverpool]|nr:conserved hypothetical protein [Neospora caninum Liverpool]CBZ50262.1 conserved hypothetical protein [Neospora caninum Liverpool]|eukprot:XP_003880296.1 conserved hypothetical protein [Neospora caninum Liverpool]
MHRQPGNEDNAVAGEVKTSPATQRKHQRGVCLQQRLNCRFAPFYELVKDIVDDERARRDFLLREEEVKHVFEAYRQEKARREHDEDGGWNGDGKQPTDASMLFNKRYEGDCRRNSGTMQLDGDVTASSRNRLLSVTNQDGIGSVDFEEYLLPDGSNDGSAAERRRSREYCPIMVEDIQELLDRLDAFWEMGGRMIQQFQESSPPLVATENADIISYILPQQQAELVILDADDVQAGEFWFFLKNYTEVQTWIRRELYNKRKQEIQVQPESKVRRALVEGLMRRNMIVVEKQNDGDEEQDAELTEQQRIANSRMQASAYA